MKLQRIRSGRALRTGSLAALGALIVAPLLVATQTAQADPIVDAIARAKANQRYSDRSRDNRHDDHRDNDRGRDDNRNNDHHDYDHDRNNGGKWGNRPGNDRDHNRSDRERWERERRERERRERLERERRERERRDRDRWNDNNSYRPGGGWNNNRPNYGNGNWNWNGNSNRDSFVITGTVADSLDQQNTLRIRLDNGQIYTIRTYQAERFRLGDRVRVSGNRNSDNPQISLISRGYGGRR